jgi:hypothetical protein
MVPPRDAFGRLPRRMAQEAADTLVRENGARGRRFVECGY